MMCCAEKGGCQRPEELKGRPEECTPEQIERCHGSTQDHPCASEEKKKN